jgi:hypothetical protein
VVATESVYAALRWVGKHIFLKSGLPDALRYVFFFRKRLARELEFHELHAQQEPESSDLAYMGMRFQRSERRAKNFRGWCYALK